MTYSIGEIEDLTGIKSHILRYWEEIIPSFTPKKDLSGRRIYTQRDLDLILRLKYLIYEKKFTIEGARDELISEISNYDQKAEIFDSLRQIRQQLSEMYMIIRKYR